MRFRITGLDPEPFAHLYGLSDEALRQHGAIRYVVDRKPCYPDRIELRDADLGETVLLLNYTHQPADTPYRASHAIFVREGAREAFDGCDQVPQALRIRRLSLRAFDGAHSMVAATTVEGTGLEPEIGSMFANPAVAYIHAHYAAPGCYAARIDRA